MLKTLQKMLLLIRIFSRSFCSYCMVFPFYAILNANNDLAGREHFMQEYEKRGYLLENFRLFHLRSEGGAKVDFHYHEFCKLIMLISGRGSYHVDGNHYLLSPGDIVTIGSRSIHRPEMDPAEPYERIIIYIAPEYLQAMSTGDCDLMTLFSGEQGHVLRPREQQRQRLFHLVSLLERDMESGSFGWEILSRGDLLRLLVEIERCREDRNASRPSPSQPKSKRILEILQYLDDNLSEPLDIDQLAEKFYISKYYMMRLFHKEVGTTIHGYLTHKRLSLAREWIQGGMSATEACYQSGFRNYSSFTRAYGKHFGTTPTGRMDKGLVREEDFE